MRSSLITRGLSATAAVLLLTACGGGGSDEEAASSSSSSPASTSAAESSSSAPEADSEFCSQAQDFGDSITGSLDTTDPSGLSDSLQQAADGLRGIDPPAEIADDWNSLADALGQAAGSLDGVDLTDPDEAAKVQAELTDLQTEVGTAGTNVETYLRDQCGIDTEGTGTSSDSAAPSS